MLETICTYSAFSAGCAKLGNKCGGDLYNLMRSGTGYKDCCGQLRCTHSSGGWPFANKCE